MARRSRILFGVACAALAALAGWLLLTRTPETFVVGLTAVGDGSEALVLLRHNEGDASFRSWAALVDEEGTTRWTVELPGVAHGRSVTGNGVTAIEDTVTVACHDDGPVVEPADQRVVALALSDGSEKWRSRPVSATFYTATAGDAAQIFELYWDGEDSHVRALDRETGRVRWHRNVIFNNRKWLALTDSVLSYGRSHHSARSLARSDGETVLSVDAGDAMCAAGGRLWYMRRDGERGWVLHDVSLAGRRPRSRPLDWERVSAFPPGVACGVYGDLFVFDFVTEGGTGLAAADPEQGRVVWEIDLGGWSPARTGNPLTAYSMEFPHRGRLPRYLWMPVERVVGEPGLVLVDLEAREVSHLTGPIEGIRRIFAFRRGEVTYVTLGSDRLVAFTGPQLTAAVLVPESEPLVPPQVGRERLWLYRSLSSHHLEDQGLAVLDAASLEPISTRGGFQVTGVTAETRELLGL